MNRNTEQHFSMNPTNLEMPRSRFERSTNHKTTFNTGELIPLFVDEVLPGDTMKAKTAAAIRMSTPIYPVMDDAFMDTYWFFVPNRLVWEHWKEFMGENTTTKWEQTVEYEIPQITAPSGGWAKGTIADYFGIPTNVNNISVNALPFRALALIWNEWFRDQNMKDPAMVNQDDTTVQGSNGANYQVDGQLGGKPFKVAKYADYFTKCLPSPQKGPSVALPITTSGYAPVVTRTVGTELSKVRTPMMMYQNLGNIQYFSYHDRSAGDVEMTTPKNSFAEARTIAEQYPSAPKPINLWADLSDGAANAATINQLRQAFAVQRWYEQSARGGSRYRETLKAFFGVTSPDSRMQIPEYLGGERIPINVDQVVQTSGDQGEGSTPQGNVAAFSLTSFVQHSFVKSFAEHGYLFCVGAIRTMHTYQQGIERMWSRKDKFDFYWPTFANLGEMAVLNKEIFATGTDTDNEVFGYQEAWADYRYKPSRVSGAFRSNYQQSLDSWHYADYYENQPILGSTWIDETTENVNRTIAVQDELEDQFIGDFYFQCENTRCMPVYSVPGLLDHH